MTSSIDRACADCNGTRAVPAGGGEAPETVGNGYVPCPTCKITVKVGDFFVRSWGYDQTNIDFYRVMEVSATGKSVKVQKWSQTVEYGESSTDHVVPGDGPRTWQRYREVTEDGQYARRPDGMESAPIKPKRLSGSGEHLRITAGSYGDHAYLWDGKPEYQTASGWGH